jgi:hypothetical protein
MVGAVLFGLLMLVAGCGRPPTGPRDDKNQVVAKGDPWEAAAKRLRSNTNLVACRAALSSLNQELTNGDKAEKPTSLSAQDEAALTAIVPLQETDRDEIRPAAFTPHDPVYLAECFYLRDAARSLVFPGLSPEQQADLGFSWVCRQVNLNPWLISPGDRILAAALPPAYILRRGSGSALERMYVFIALLQQMGLDGCLIGPPNPGEVGRYSALASDQRSALSGGPARPFWAVGVRLEKGGRSDIKLYDPWRGEAFPAPFSQLKANPESYRSWFQDPANVSGVSTADAKNAMVFLAVPVNALPPRMAMLDKKLDKSVDINLAIDPKALRDRFPDPKPTYWNPPNDRYAYGRTARRFLPLDQGGTDREPASAIRHFDGYFRSQLPDSGKLTPPELRQVELSGNKEVIRDINERIGTVARQAYGMAFLEPPTPRERIQRGQFQEASRVLVERRDDFAKSRDRVRNTPDADQVMREWVAKAAELYRGLDGGAAATAALDEHWRSTAATLLFDRAIGEAGQAQAAYLLALCRHEEAERAQARYEHASTSEAKQKLKADAITAWDKASRAWSGYREQHAAAHAGLTGQSEQVAMLVNRAKKLARQ